MRWVVCVVLLGGLLAGVPPSTQGQDGPQYGLTLGFNWATLDSPARPGTHTAFAGGLVLRQHVFGPFSVQSELLLNQKGVEVDGEQGGGIAYSAGYVELPVLVHLKTPSVGAVAFHAEVGGFGGVKIFERQTPGSGELNIPLRTGRSFYRRFDIGGVAGIGATLSIRDRRLNVTLRHAWGLVNGVRNVDNQPFPEAPFPARGETRTLSLLLRFGF